MVQTDSTSERSFAQSLLRLRPHARDITPRLALGLITAILSAGMALAIPQVLQWLINGPLFDERNATALWWGVGLVLLLGVFEAVLLSVRRVFVLSPGTRLEARLRVLLFGHLAELPAGFHDQWSSGQLLSRSMSDIRRFRRWLSFGMIMIAVNSITIAAGVTLMLMSSWVLGLIYVIAAIPAMIASFKFRRSYRVLSRRSQDIAGDLATVVEEAARGIRILKSFGRGDDALQRFSVRAGSLRDTEIAKARALSTVSMVLAVLPETALAIALTLGLFLVADGQLTIGAIVAFFATATIVNGPIDRLGEQFAMSMDAKTAVDRYFEVLDTTNDLTDPDVPRTPERAGGRLEYDEVTFRYPDAAANAAPLLEGFSLALRSGETIAIVGETGSGKSTIAQLAPRLYDVDEGSVRIDGVDVRDLPLEVVRQRVAIAFEEPILFSASVRENVLLGAPDAADDELDWALGVAQAQFVYSLPEGVDTQIGEDGLSLSGGQRQRIALARAIVGRPSILVLDDPLSALDVHTEAAVTELLRDALRETTTLIIAHRPSTVALADRVALLIDGRIVAVDTHTNLLATSPEYREIITSGAEADIETELDSDADLGTDADAEGVARR